MQEERVAWVTHGGSQSARVEAGGGRWGGSGCSVWDGEMILIVREHRLEGKMGTSM